MAEKPTKQHIPSTSVRTSWECTTDRTPTAAGRGSKAQGSHRSEQREVAMVSSHFSTYQPGEQAAGCLR